MSKYVSILEFSKRAGVSKQAVYQRLDRDLSSYCSTDGKRRVIDLQALSLFGVKQVDKPLSQVDSKQDNQQVDLYLRMIDMLERQLEIKDKQLETKDRQIEALTRTINNTGALVDQQQKLHALTGKTKEESDSLDPEPRHVRRVPRKRRLFPFRR